MSSNVPSVSQKPKTTPPTWLAQTLRFLVGRKRTTRDDEDGLEGDGTDSHCLGGEEGGDVDDSGSPAPKRRRLEEDAPPSPKTSPTVAPTVKLELLDQEHSHIALPTTLHPSTGVPSLLAGAEVKLETTSEAFANDAKITGGEELQKIVDDLRAFSCSLDKEVTPMAAHSADKLLTLLTKELASSSSSTCANFPQ